MAVIGIIGDLSFISIPHICDQFAPVLFFLLRAQHFTADAEHLTAGLFCKLRIIMDQTAVSVKPGIPVRIPSPLVRVGEGNAGAPDAVGRV